MRPVVAFRVHKHGTDLVFGALLQFFADDVGDLDIRRNIVVDIYALKAQLPYLENLCGREPHALAQQKPVFIQYQVVRKHLPHTQAICGNIPHERSLQYSAVCVLAGEETEVRYVHNALILFHKRVHVKYETHTAVPQYCAP